MIFEIFGYNSQNFPKISELFLEIILRNTSRKCSKYLFLEISEIFEMIFEIFRQRIFRNIYQNVMK